MKKLCLVILLPIVMTAGAFAADVTVPHNFSAGETISASKFNDNFTTIENALAHGTWVSLTLNAQWGSYNTLNAVTEYYEPEYRIDGLGFVHMRGVVQSTASGNIIATLPVGFRPFRTLALVAFTSDTSKAMYIYPDGQIEVLNTSGGRIISFDGVSFEAEQ